MRVTSRSVRVSLSGGRRGLEELEDERLRRKDENTSNEGTKLTSFPSLRPSPSSSPPFPPDRPWLGPPSNSLPRLPPPATTTSRLHPRLLLPRHHRFPLRNHSQSRFPHERSWKHSARNRLRSRQRGDDRGACDFGEVEFEEGGCEGYGCDVCDQVSKRRGRRRGGKTDARLSLTLS